jgi:GNAT superfamily N-acetyltransferase
MNVRYLEHVVSLLLAALPTIMVWSSKSYVIRRRKEMLAQDFKASNRNSSDAFDQFLASRGGIERLQRQVAEYMSDGLWFPLFALTLLNAAGFALGLLYLRDPAVGIAPFDAIIFTFLGAYLFNLGVLTRRLALSDFNAQMLWSAINGLLLSVGLCLVLGKVPGIAGHPQSFFAIGFLSNLFLEMVLNGAQVVTAVVSKKRNDGMSLQMVRGINFWKAHRLEEEGIENIQNLATADVLELVVRTHYNLMTLVDWIDQAIVISRFREATCTLEDAGLNISAIDLGWSSPAYRGESAVAESIADTLKVSRSLVTAQMNSLYEDQFVRNLWVLWQTRPGFDSANRRSQSDAPGLRAAVAVRATTTNDIDAIVDLSHAVYPNDVYRCDVIAHQIENFPEGQFVALSEDGVVVGMSSCQLMRAVNLKMDDSWDAITAEGTLTSHEAGGDTIYGVETMVHPGWRRNGVGTQLIRARFKLAQSLSVHLIRTGIRLAGYGAVATRLSPVEYVDQVVSGKLSDPSLSFMLHLGFKLRGVSETYLKRDPESAGCAAILDYRVQA